MRLFIAILSIAGFITVGCLAVLIKVISSSWGNEADISLSILLSLFGFAAILCGSVFGYGKPWYKPVAFLGASVIVFAGFAWFSENAEWAGVGMFLVAALIVFDASKNH